MSHNIVIIGSGFAAYQLVKAIRRSDNESSITVITADNGDDYNKPDLSHVFTKAQTAADLINQHADDFANQYNIRLLNNTKVSSIDTTTKTVVCESQKITYQKLVLATGAKAFIPPMKGNETDQIITLNSLDEFKASRAGLVESKSVMVIGAGLIGTEIAMDLASSGKQVILTDLADTLLPNLLPEFISSQLYQCLSVNNVSIQLSSQVHTIDSNANDNSLVVTLTNGNQYDVDHVICAVGLTPNTQLAKNAGIASERGVMVDEHLATSVDDVYALGDCAQINGKLLPFLQPILLSANALAKTLTGQISAVRLPAMMVKVKTPMLPLQLSGDTTNSHAKWQVDVTKDGLTAKAYDQDEKLIGFVVTQDHMKHAFPLLRDLPTVI